MTDPAGQDPVAEYKEILEATRQAAKTLTERERTRSIEVIAELAAADRAIKQATDAENQVAKEVAAWWRQVVSSLTGLNWLTTGRPPDPDPAGKPERLEDYLSEIEPATNTLHAAIRKATWPKRSS